MAGERFRTVVATGVLSTVLASALVLGGERIATTYELDVAPQSPPPATAAARSFETREVALADPPTSDGGGADDEGWAVRVPALPLPPVESAAPGQSGRGGGSLDGEATTAAPAGPALPDVDPADEPPAPLIPTEPVEPAPSGGEEPSDEPTVLAAGSGERRAVVVPDVTDRYDGADTPDRPTQRTPGAAERWRWHRTHDLAAEAAAAGLRRATPSATAHPVETAGRRAPEPRGHDDAERQQDRVPASGPREQASLDEGKPPRTSGESAPIGTATAAGPDQNEAGPTKAAPAKAAPAKAAPDPGGAESSAGTGAAGARKAAVSPGKGGNAGKATAGAGTGHGKKPAKAGAARGAGKGAGGRGR